MRAFAVVDYRSHVEAILLINPRGLFIVIPFVSRVSTTIAVVMKVFHHESRRTPYNTLDSGFCGPLPFLWY